MTIQCKIFLENEEIQFFNFPSGETGLKLTDLFLYKYLDTQSKFKREVTITFVGTDSDLIKLGLLVERINDFYIKEVKNNYRLCLNFLFVPLSRQDRNDSESPCSIKVVANYINSLNFNEVYLFDPHSDVSAALINNSIVIPQSKIIYEYLNRKNRFYDCLVIPDAGASKKSYEVAKILEIRNCIQANKHRDIFTGEILNTELSLRKDSYIAFKNVLIVDDICDGGKTFIELAKIIKLYTPMSINLFTTYGLYTKGKDPLIESGFDRVMCYFNLSDYQSTNQMSIPKLCKRVKS